jgi:hypothetical protein
MTADHRDDLTPRHDDPNKIYVEVAISDFDDPPVPTVWRWQQYWVAVTIGEVDESGHYAFKRGQCLTLATELARLLGGDAGQIVGLCEPSLGLLHAYAVVPDVRSPAGVTEWLDVDGAHEPAGALAAYADGWPDVFTVTFTVDDVAMVRDLSHLTLFDGDALDDLGWCGAEVPATQYAASVAPSIVAQHCVPAGPPNPDPIASLAAAADPTPPSAKARHR